MNNYFNSIIIGVLIMISISLYAQPSGITLLWEKSVDVNTMEFSPDGSLLITGGINCFPYTCGQMNVWVVADSALLYSWGNINIGRQNDIELSNDGQKIITGNGSIYCTPFGCTPDRAGQFEYTISGGQIYSDTNPDGIIYSIAYSPDNSIIAAGTGYNNSGHINVYDEQYTLLGTLAGHSTSTTSLVFTPDRQYLISGGADGKIKFWDYINGTLEQTLQHGNYLNGGTNVRLSLSNDGQYLASTGEGNNVSVKIWKVSDGSLIHTFTNNNEYGGLSFVEFSPNGLYLYNVLSLYESGGLGNHALLRFYEVATGNLVREYIDSLNISVNNGVRAIGLSPTGNNFFAYSTGYATTARLRLALTDLDLVNNSPIPVELVSFTASVTENTTTLSWKTGSEVNNSGFEIQRKKSSDWEKIGFVEGQETTSEEKTYLFIDENLYAGRYQYRLKQIDYDGSFEFSNIVEVEILTPIEFSLSQNYPNPFNPTTTIQFSIPESGNVNLIVFNALGEEVKTLVNEFKEPGSYTANFNASDLGSGIYYYRLQNNDFIETKKMVIMK